MIFRRFSWTTVHVLPLSLPINALCAAEDCGLGPQMLREPVGGGGCCAQELVGVGREVAAGVELQPLRLASAGERSQGEVGGADDVGVANHHEECGWRDAFDE